MREAEFLQIDVNSRLAELSTEAMSVEATTPTLRKSRRKFERRTDLPGAIVFEGDAMVGVISRETFYRRLSGPYCRVLFFRKPVRHLLEILQSTVMRLPADCTIHRATELVLARPAGETYEPIVVDFGEKGLRLLDAHMLLSAQSHLMSTSREALGAATRRGRGGQPLQDRLSRQSLATSCELCCRDRHPQLHAVRVERSGRRRRPHGVAAVLRKRAAQRGHAVKLGERSCWTTPNWKRAKCC